MSNERFGENRYAKMGVLTGLNYAAQGIGSIIISPLIKRLPTRYVLCAAVILFSVVSAMILIVDAATGGIVKFKTKDNTTHYGTWNPNGEHRARRGTGRSAASETIYQSSFPSSPFLASLMAWLSSFGESSQGTS
jgi:MFS family permease